MGDAPQLDHRLVHRIEDSLIDNVRPDCPACGNSTVLTGPGAAHAAAIVLRTLVDLGVIEEEAALDAVFAPDEAAVPYVPEHDKADEG